MEESRRAQLKEPGLLEHKPTPIPFDDADRLAVASLRGVAIDMVEAARSGHPGAPLGLAPAAWVLFSRFVRHDPAQPDWLGRDRFLLSAGHASALLYGLLHIFGYADMADLKAFRQLGSRTPGHPERRCLPGVEYTTGPLGQGFAGAVGMALAREHLAHLFHPGLFSYRIFVICSDGDLMEGVSHEAAALAGHLGLGNLLIIWDDNGVSIDGPTSLAFTEDVVARFRAYGFATHEVRDGEDLEELASAFQAALDPERPALVRVRTIIGKGAPTKEGTAASHGAPLGPEEAAAAKASYGLDPAVTFHVPPEVYARASALLARGRAERNAWERTFAAWTEEEPERAAELQRILRGEVPEQAREALRLLAASPRPAATRKASGAALEVLSRHLPELVTGSADLSESTATKPASHEPVGRGRWGRHIHFGVREHAMAGAGVGMALEGLRPVLGTFLVFSDYLRPALRIAAMQQARVVFVFTHDSIGVGEDGPTHQPVEHIASLRAMPGLVVIRPADWAETALAWEAALDERGPVALVLTRQEVPALPRPPLAPANGLLRGAYVLLDAGENPDVVLIGSGSEVALCVEAAAVLKEKGVLARVVSMPSWELFLRQPRSYQEEVLPPEIGARVAVEAASPLGWHRWVGADGRVVGLDRFGASGPAREVLSHFGFTAERVAQETLALLEELSSAPGG